MIPNTYNFGQTQYLVNYCRWCLCEMAGSLTVITTPFGTKHGNRVPHHVDFITSRLWLHALIFSRVACRLAPPTNCQLDGNASVWSEKCLVVFGMSINPRWRAIRFSLSDFSVEIQEGYEKVLTYTHFWIGRAFSVFQITPTVLGRPENLWNGVRKSFRVSISNVWRDMHIG